jgi:hypothetical protein
VTTPGYQQIISSSETDRRGLYLATAARLGTPLGNVEKDFWVCWTLDQLYRNRRADQPRLLFKGGTSLSKAHGLIKRFSEDIDVTVYRDDLGQPASVADLERLSGKKRQTKLDDIKAACAAYIGGELRDELGRRLADATDGKGKVEIDPDDRDGQTLLVWYPASEHNADGYVKPAVRIESGAKSALDPNSPAVIKPYLAEEVADLDLAVPGVATISAERTFWDKIVIAHGLRRWFERRGELRNEGHRISRHYYDLHTLASLEVGRAALADAELGADCVRHARMFFNRPDYDLASASQGGFDLVPTGAMRDALRRDYAATEAMIFGTAPSFDDVMDSIERVAATVNCQ